MALLGRRADNQVELTAQELLYMTGQPVHVYNKDNQMMTYSGADITVRSVHQNAKKEHIVTIEGPNGKTRDLKFYMYLFYKPVPACPMCQIKEVEDETYLCKDCMIKTVVETGIKITTTDDVITNELGGSQSRIEYAFEELEPEMLRRVAHVLYIGKMKYGSKNWRNISYDDHINHLMYHAIQANEGTDKSEDHLANAICRAMFAMCVDVDNNRSS